MDHEWYRIYRLFERYKNAGNFKISPLEFELSFKNLDQVCIQQICFGNSTLKVQRNNQFLCIEPTISSTFIETFIQVRLLNYKF